MKKKMGSYITLGIGLVLLLAGLWLLRTVSWPEGVLLVLPYICIGVGCGLFGHGMGNAVSERVLKKYPEVARQKEIEENDERNVAIAERSKARAFDLMTFVLGALMLCFALMQVDLALVLLLVCAYLFIEGYALYCRFRLEKEM